MSSKVYFPLGRVASKTYTNFVILLQDCRQLTISAIIVDKPTRHHQKVRIRTITLQFFKTRFPPVNGKRFVEHFGIRNGRRSFVHGRMKRINDETLPARPCTDLTYITSKPAITYFLTGAAHSIICRSKGSPAIRTIHVTAIITHVYHDDIGSMYLLGWQVLNTMYQGEEIN